MRKPLGEPRLARRRMLAARPMQEIKRGEELPRRRLWTNRFDQRPDKRF